MEELLGIQLEGKNLSSYLFHSWKSQWHWKAWFTQYFSVISSIGIKQSNEIVIVVVLYTNPRFLFNLLMFLWHKPHVRLTEENITILLLKSQLLCISIILWLESVLLSLIALLQWFIIKVILLNKVTSIARYVAMILFARTLMMWQSNKQPKRKCFLMWLSRGIAISVFISLIM